jgi:hypothetical protein
MKDNLTYSEAIEKLMLENGYFAPLKLLYQGIWKYKDKSKIKGKTPDFTIMERVQRDPRFTKIGLGVYALTDYLDKLNSESKLSLKNQSKEDRLHAKVQGMLIEIGNSKRDVEYTYTNDKKWIFENKTLGSLATLKDVPFFTYENIIKDSVRYADVIWFNKRGFPSKIFEVEESTDFRDAFIKFSELQDFVTVFCCVSEERRRDKFSKEISKTAFIPIKDRCQFFSYEQIENDYKIALSKTFL